MGLELDLKKRGLTNKILCGEGNKWGGSEEVLGAKW